MESIRIGGIMAQVEYTEYDPSFAKAVAAMWNRSSAGWNGQVWNSSEARVLQEERDSAHLNLWLALSGEDVVGYAKLAKYDMEPGVAYVELISVDPAWHGKGVGKALMQKCVERSAELGYQRLDLFTWAGNTQAVPLYKKCGFFWERMETQATHLMNFLPGILNSPFFRPHFDHFHWYDDLKRELEVAPDGREERGFEYYDYLWEKDGRKLAVSFEKTGRGIAAFATDEIAVECLVDQARPVFGGEHKVSYKFNNHSGKPIPVRIEGRNDVNVAFNASHGFQLGDQAVWEAGFSLSEPQFGDGEWQTLPGVRALLSLGGQSVEMKTGLKTQYPLSFSMFAGANLLMPNREYELHLNVQNHFDTAAEFEIEILPQEPVTLVENRHRISLAAQARSSVSLSFSLSRGCLWTPLARVTARPETGGEVTFEKRCEAMLMTFEARDQKTLERYHALINGLHVLTVGIREGKNRASLSTVFGDYCHTMCPMLGEPFSEEFEHLDPQEVRFEDLGGANQLTLSFRSQDFPGAEFALIHRLHPSGMLELRTRAISLPENAKTVLRLRMMTNSSFITYEHEGELRSLERDQVDAELECLPEATVTGNFIYHGREGITTGIVWDPALKVKVHGWYLAWDLDLSAMLQAGTLESKPIQVFLNQFQNALQLRDYARGAYIPYEAAHPSLELRANFGNPILNGPFRAELLWRQDRDLTGKFSLSAEGRPVASPMLLEQGSGQRGLDWEVLEFPEAPLAELCCDAAFPLYHIHRRQVLFQPRGKVNTDSGGNWLRVDNGVLKLGASTKAILPVLLSLETADGEWLDQAWPDFQSKSFYNPYPGGLHVRPDRISLAELSKETHRLDFTEVSDQHGNSWQGLVYDTRIDCYKPLRGLRFRQYYLTLPGLPLLAVTTEVVSGTGFAGYESFPLMGFFAPGGKLDNCRMHFPLDAKRWQSLEAGKEVARIWETLRHLRVENKSSADQLHFLSPSKTEMTFHIDRSVARFRSENYSPRATGYPKWLKPVFIIFSPERLEWASCSQLLDLGFVTDPVAARNPH